MLAKADQLSEPVKRRLAAAFPGWSIADGVCPQCAAQISDRYGDEFSPSPLNINTDPHTTFPYWHVEEETVLAQPIRLPDYTSFGGHNVTIAFLDSGFYPHPDLLSSSTFPGAPEWSRMTPAQLRALLSRQELRLLTYVDLTDGRTAIGLEQDSLWDGSGVSWHGQMTTTIAVGNGLLSGGHFRGYAPRANVLPIKIGLGNGRIPESEILAGFNWLLRNDNWERYSVRVLNASVGGDFPQPWYENAVCRAAEELSAQGVLVAAAAGNSGRPHILAPAQAPSVLTVGGYDDHNRRWNVHAPEKYSRLTRYHHNTETISDGKDRVQKPEILALGRYLPSPILPVNAVFREMHAIARLRQTLLGDDQRHMDALLDHWHSVMHVDDDHQRLGTLLSRRAAAVDRSDSLPEIWQSLRKRMNAHKWVHDSYQHVDGTSVSVAQVSAVAAQMMQANPSLTGQQVKTLMMATAWHPPHWSDDQAAGILQPALAVAAALRSPGGILAGYPRSNTEVSDSMLRRWLIQGKVAHEDIVDRPLSGQERRIYVGLYAPQARAVSLIGSFNHWAPGAIPLQRTPVGWWHAVVPIPPGKQRYRFWVSDRHSPDGDWRVDPENPLRDEGGYRQPQSVFNIGAAGG